MDGLPSLTDVVAQLREDLLVAITEGEGEDLRFGVEEVRLDVQGVVTNNGSGGLSFKVMGIGFEGAAGISAESTVKLSLLLTPELTGPDGESRRVNLSRDD